MKDDLLYLRDILDQVEVIISEGENMTFEEFQSRPIYRNGMIHSIIIIGEAAKRLSEEFKMAHPDFPISSLARTRDKLVHGYRGTDYVTVWKIITKNIPMLKEDVIHILDEFQ